MSYHTSRLGEDRVYDAEFARSLLPFRRFDEGLLDEEEDRF